MSSTVGVIDYGSGNFASVWNALSALDLQPKRIESQEDFERTTHLILPGVGSFGATMNSLNQRNLVEPIKDLVLSSDVLFMGICVGMQVLATSGLEFGEHKGLDLVPGVVDALRVEDNQLPIPHIGWAKTKIVRDSPLFRGLEEHPSFYFLHSYCFNAQAKESVILEADYGGSFLAAVQHRNIFGVQFHPEKSQRNGLQLLRNFCMLDRKDL